MSVIFDEQSFIESIINDNNSEIEATLQDKFSSEIGFNTEKEKIIYSIYQKSFIFEIYEHLYMIKIPSLKNTIFMNFTPSLIDILRCKINDEVENGNISDADTEEDNIESEEDNIDTD
jgi:hypothetical protein